MAGLERRRVGGRHQLSLAELLLDPVQRRLHRPVVQPTHDTQSEEVLAALGVPGLHSQVLANLLGEARHGHEVGGVVVERAVGERVVGVAGLVEVPLLEGVGVDDDRAAGLESTEFAAQRRRVHGHEHRGGVAGRGDDLAGDLHLEGRDAMHGARRRPDLSGEVRQGGEVVTEHGTGGGEAITGELHAVAGVAGKANDEPLEILNGGRRRVVS